MPEETLDPSATFATSSGVYARAFGEEVVLLQFATGEYFGLDSIGAEVWRAIERGESLGSTAARIAAGWDVDEIRAFRDIGAMVRDLQQHALVVRR